MLTKTQYQLISASRRPLVVHSDAVCELG